MDIKGRATRLRLPHGQFAEQPAQRATTAIAQLCEHLTTTKTRYPGTNLILRYEVKTHP